MEAVIDRLCCSRYIPTRERKLGSSYSEHLHPRIYPFAICILKVMWWWHYHVQRNACKEGSRLCWQKDHWRNGQLGPLAAELHRQLSEHHQRFKEEEND